MKRSAGHVALTVVGVALCLVLAPVLIVNCVLIAKSFMNPDEVPGVGGVTPLVVLSDSMYPEIQKDDLILCEPVDAGDIAVGDVIAFFDPHAEGSVAVVTHRVIGVGEQDGELAFETQGDANDSADVHMTLASDVIGRYTARFAGIGNVAMWMQSPAGLAVCIGVPVVVLVGYDVVRTRMFNRRRDGEAEALRAELEELRGALPGSDGAAGADAVAAAAGAALARGGAMESPPTGGPGTVESAQASGPGTDEPDRAGGPGTVESAQASGPGTEEPDHAGEPGTVDSPDTDGGDGDMG